MTNKEIKAYMEHIGRLQGGFPDHDSDTGKAIDAAIEALKKQMPKEPTYEGDGYDPQGTFIWDEWLCPNCGSRYEVDYDKYDYCPNCGQALDWSDGESCS